MDVETLFLIFFAAAIVGAIAAVLRALARTLAEVRRERRRQESREAPATLEGGGSHLSVVESDDAA
jgi:hypothetical protein